MAWEIPRDADQRYYPGAYSDLYESRGLNQAKLHAHRNPEGYDESVCYEEFGDDRWADDESVQCGQADSQRAG